ncbi:MAG: EF-hand protein [Gammaproteobacteria bacterium]|nr:EF-hand protein [Gammaproteobacteria bacterium]
MRKHIHLVSAFALVLGAQTAWTQQFTPPTFEGLDTDKSGALSKEEVGVFVAGIPAGPNGPANLDDVLGRWDANKDGSVTKEEFDNRPPPPGAGGPPPAT